MAIKFAPMPCKKRLNDQSSGWSLNASPADGIFIIIIIIIVIVITHHSKFLQDFQRRIKLFEGTLLPSRLCMKTDVRSNTAEFSFSCASLVFSGIWTPGSGLQPRIQPLELCQVFGRVASRGEGGDWMRGYQVSAADVLTDAFFCAGSCPFWDRYANADQSHQGQGKTCYVFTCWF